MKIAKTFTIDSPVSDYVDATKRGSSASERINQLLIRAIEQEKIERLEAEAAAFFSAKADKGADEDDAFRKAGLGALEKD
jgi:hypothetical protein